jgi:hypothetical protein
MKYLLLAGSLALLASCATQRTLTPARPPADATSGGRDEGPAYTPDVLTQQPGIVVQPPRTILDKLTGRTPEPVYYPPGTPVVVKGKKNTLTVNHVAGNQANTSSTVGKNGTAATGEGATATAVEKANAPVTTGPGDATDQSGTGAASTIKGNNNAPVLTNTEQKAPDWKAQLAAGFATPVGKGLALLLLAGVGYGVYRLWPVLRRKSSTANQA